jgi:hypothetical protein
MTARYRLDARVLHKIEVDLGAPAQHVMSAGHRHQRYNTAIPNLELILPLHQHIESYLRNERMHTCRRAAGGAGKALCPAAPARCR